MLTPDKLEALRAKLELEQQSLNGLAVSREEGNAAIELDQSRVGRLSRMDALAGAQMTAETQRRRARQLQNISRALKKLDAGQYGDCEECLEPIQEARLELNPSVELCIGCASRAEG